MQQVTLSDLVRLHNAGTKPYVGEWNSRRYTVQPGEDGHIPFELAKKDFGDPRSADAAQTVKNSALGIDEIIPDRPAEVMRLYQYWLPSEYGTNRVHFREFVPGDRTFAADGISDRIPQVEIYTLAGDRIFTVADDPYGDSVIAAVPTRSDREALDELLRKQSTTIAAQEDAMKQMRADMEMLMHRLNNPLDDPGAPQDLGPDLPLGSPAFAPPRPTAPQDGVVEENPPMVMNPRSGRVTRKKNPQAGEPTRLEDLPTDHA